MTEYTVKPGDCLLSIAKQHGMPWQSIWEHPENKVLRDLRKDPSVLYPGDVLKIPERSLRTEDRPTDKRHRFLRASDPAKVRIRILVDDIPKVYQPFTLMIGERKITGKTDGNGHLEASIPPDASEGVLSLGSDSDKLRFPIKFGLLDPVDTDSGIQQRLGMLGFDVRAGLAQSIKAFQGGKNLQQTGSADEATREQLKKEFGQ